MTNKKFLIVFLLLSGCAWLQPDPHETVYPIEDENHWEIKGRIGITQEDEAWSATIIWAQDGDHFKIQLIAPLGQGTTAIEKVSQGVKARFPDGQVVVYSHPKQIFQDQLGVEIPINSLRYWVIGRPDASIPVKIRRNDLGVIEEMIQNGWEVSYLRYADHGLPSKILVENKSVEVKLVIKSWK